jgi:aldehyde dehydrogenase (NAD+)
VTTTAEAPTRPLDVPATVAQLRATFESGRTRSLDWRRDQLKRLRSLLVERESELLAALAADLGKPPTEAWATDIGFVISEIDHALRHLRSWVRPRRVWAPLVTRPARASIVREPLGVVLVIAPWNCVVAKPSEVAASTSATLARLIPKYVDTEAVAVVEGGVRETQELLAERFDYVFYTGNGRVGRIVMEAAAKHLTPVTLELGGKSPVIVDDTANLDVAARRVAWGKYLNAGQTCIAPDYVLADREIRDRLVDKLQGQITQFYGAEPKSSTSLGRIVNERHTRRLQGLLDQGAGTVVTGGQVDLDARYVAPTITLDPSPESPVMQEEIFGPILPVLAVDGPAEAKAFMTARPKPLALYVFAGDDAVVTDVVDNVSSGGVCINQTLMHFLPADLPFGGVGDSGMGAYHGKAGFDVFSHQKSVLKKPTRPDLKMLYPPYKPRMEKLVRQILK